ncbi:MAG: hypothetical protein ABJO29_10250 [Yoonia sp.]|uniref:hypothetical protein n=1 Tax=Yoonia sp. TaxID=2212373 RepID=UPI00220E5E97|nr:hypothetical protein K3729_04020 [Rhodobacteraceae bacterium S2214]
MTLNEAMAEFGPSWLRVWLPLLMLGGFVAPVVLIFWSKTRMIGIISIVASLIAAFAIDYMYKQMGYVKLLGLPHIIMWTPLIVYLIMQNRREDFPTWPKRILTFMIVIIGISLVFDYVDAVRYFLGNTMPLVMYDPA